MDLGKIPKLLGSILLAQLAGIIGSFFTVSSIGSWYVLLEKPFFTPPNWIIGPVWIILYTIMGIAFFLILEAKGEKRKTIHLYLLQLGLNALWSILFFGAQLLWLAFLEIILLWIAIFITMLEFYKLNKKAAYLMIPYILWVTFAGILNLALAILN